MLSRIDGEHALDRWLIGPAELQESTEWQQLKSAILYPVNKPGRLAIPSKLSYVEAGLKMESNCGRVLIR